MYRKAMQGISCIAILISTSKNPWSSLLMFILASPKLEIRAKQFLLRDKGVGRGKGQGWRGAREK
jgi:hypothetical protein